MALINGYQLSLFTQAGGFIQIGWNIEEGSFPELRKQPFNPFIDQLDSSLSYRLNSRYHSIFNLGRILFY